MPDLSDSLNNKDSIFQIPESCPNCVQKYDQAKVNVLNSGKDNIIIHITCPNCKTSVISNISVNNMRVVAVGMLTDLSKEDLFLLRKSQIVNIDDVIEMHEFIEKEGSIKIS